MRCLNILAVRLKQKHYQAWQVINTAQGHGGSGGRLEALQELNADGISLVGVDVSTAYLQGIQLGKARLVRANFSAADLRDSNLRNVDLDNGNLRAANLRGSDLSETSLHDADFTESDLTDASLAGADLSGAVLDAADLSKVNLQGVKWQQIRSIAKANIDGVRNAPDGFVAWALKHNAERNSSPVEAANSSALK